MNGKRIHPKRHLIDFTRAAFHTDRTEIAMLNQITCRSLTFLFALAAGIGLLGTPLAHADKHHDLSDPTAWAYFSNADSAALDAQINLGYRIIDLDVVQASPMRFDAALVRNTGTYASGWWWYTDQTLTQLGNLAVANNARVIEISAYQAAAGLRYAGVMIPNTGSEAEQFVLRENLTVAGVAAWATKGDFQGFGVVYDIEAYSTANGTRYAIIGLGNAFSSPDTIDYRLGLTSAALATVVAANSSRILDLEVEPNGTFAAVFSYFDGFQGSSHTFWDLPFSELTTVAGQYASRIVDITKYVSAGTTKFAIVLRRNAADPMYTLNRDMRAMLTNPLTDSGFLVRELDGLVRTALNEGQVFEPASTMKTVHAFTAMLRVAQGSDNLMNNCLSPTTMTEPTGSCPDLGSPWTSTSLNTALQGMLQQSNNRYTEGVRARYGTAAIVSNAHLVGASNVGINHMIGCLANLPGAVENTITLNDLYAIHTAASGGMLGAQESTFRGLFWNYGQSTALPVDSVVTEELAQSGLSSADVAEFLSYFRMSAKGGGYTVNGVEHRSWGFYMSVPIKAFGCAIVNREFFFGTFINDHDDATEANAALTAIVRELARIPLREAIDQWREASCGGETALCVDYALQGVGGVSTFEVSTGALALEWLSIGATFNNIAGGVSWAGDLIVRIDSPEGESIEFGGYDFSYGVPDAGDFPAASWNSSVSGDYHWVGVNVAAFGLQGTGSWRVTVRNGWNTSPEVAWSGGVCLRGITRSSGDLNMDGFVDAADLAVLLSQWNCSGQGCIGDINGDFVVNAADLATLLARWT